MPEAILLAAVTILVYLFAMAYQYGFEEPFGLYYISLEPDKIFEAWRTGILPLVIAGSLTVLVALITAWIWPPTRREMVHARLFLLAPIIYLVVFSAMLRFSMRDYTVPLILFLLYLATDRSVLEKCRLWLGFQLNITDIRFRYAQIAIGASILVVLAYDEGRFDATHLAEVSLCHDHTGNYMVIQYSSDVVICAAFDYTGSTVFKDFLYFKIPDDGRPLEFRTLQFHPTKLGVIR